MKFKKHYGIYVDSITLSVYYGDKFFFKKVSKKGGGYLPRKQFFKDIRMHIRNGMSIIAYRNIE